MKVKRRSDNSRETEEAHQIALFSWIRTMAGMDDRYNNIIAIPMGGKRSVAVAAKLKAGGAKAGVSDIFVAVPMGRYHGLWIELKAPIVKGRSKPETRANQTQWLEQQRALGYGGTVCYGWDAAMLMIVNYFKLK